MSCKINISDISTDTLSRLKSKAVLKIDNNGKPDLITLTRLIKNEGGDNVAFIPFSMARQFNLSIPQRIKFPAVSMEFVGTLSETRGNRYS